MSRDPIQTVTLPVLVEVDRIRDADGRGNFLPGDRAEESLVRVVRKEDLKAARLHAMFEPKELPLLLEATRLKQALDMRDDFVLQQASERVRPWLSDFVDLSDREWKTANGRFEFKTKGLKRYAALLNFSRLMAENLQNARLVMWFSERHRRMLPAVYCPDWKTAIFVMAFLGRLRVCPKCTETFIPKADNQAYCCIGHRESHRVQRSRWRAKQGAKEKRAK